MSSVLKYSEDELETWIALNQLNLTEFIQKTYPSFVIMNCRLNRRNCQFSWKLRQTYLGTCLELNTGRITDQHVEEENTKINDLYTSVRKLNREKL